MSNDLGPPPAYNDVVASSGLSASDPMLTRTYGPQPGNRQPFPAYSSQGPLDEDISIDETPQSSDDEETVRLKADLRKLREEKRKMQHGERLAKKKFLLKQALEKEQNDLRAGAGAGNQLSTSTGQLPGGINPSAPLQPGYFPYNVASPSVSYTPNMNTPVQLNTPAVPEYRTTETLHIDTPQNNIGGGTSDGSFRKTAYFKCPPDSAVCVGIHRIRRHKGARTKKRQAEGAEAESPCLRESPGNLPSDLRIGDRIVWHSDIGPEPGVVKWIGKLDEDNIDWTVGVEFDNRVGSGTGRYKSKRLFIAKQDHASLIPMLGLMKESEFYNSSPSNNRGARTKKRQAEGAEAESPCLRESPGNLPSDLRIGDRIVWHSDIGPEPGVVKWIGKLDEDNIDWTVGVEFDNRVGSGTGRYKSKRLFIAKQDHASLIPKLGLMKESEFYNSSPSNNREFPIDEGSGNKTSKEVIEEHECLLGECKQKKAISRSAEIQSSCILL